MMFLINNLTELFFPPSDEEIYSVAETLITIFSGYFKIISCKYAVFLLSVTAWVSVMFCKVLDFDLRVMSNAKMF